MGRAVGAAHGFGVAVVGGDDPRAAFFFQRRVDAGQALVHGFHRPDGGVELAGVAHHVGISEVDHQYIEVPALDGLHHFLGYAGGAHLRLQVVGGHFGRGNQRALFAVVGFFHPAVEKVGNVGVLLGLGYAQVAQALARKDVREDVVGMLGRKDKRHPGKSFVVARQ